MQRLDDGTFSVSGKMTSKGILCDKDDVDNCSTYPKGATDRLSYEPLAFLPANTKSVIQPCDVGKIRNLSRVIHNESGESTSFPCPSALQQKSLNIYKRYWSTSCTKPCLFLRDIFIRIESFFLYNWTWLIRYLAIMHFSHQTLKSTVCFLQPKQHFH